MQDELADMMEQAEDVQEALGRTYDTPAVDDDELAAELDALGDEIALDNDSSYLDDVLKAPEAPSNKPEREVAKNKVGVTNASLYTFQMLILGWDTSGRIRIATTSQSALIYV